MSANYCSHTMGAVGGAALLANAASFALLWAYRAADSNMRSVWLCSRNDVIGNFAVLLAPLGVFNSGKGWPDILVALVTACFALQGESRAYRKRQWWGVVIGALLFLSVAGNNAKPRPVYNSQAEQLIRGRCC